MALRDITLKVGDTLRVILDHSGPVREVELKLSPEGLNIGQSFGAPAPKAATGKQQKPAPVEVDEPEPIAPPPRKPIKAAPAPKPVSKPASRPIIDEPVETVQAVDLSFDDIPGSGAPADNPVEVRDEASGDLDDSEFNMDSDSADAPAEEEQGDAMVSQSDEPPADDGLIEDAPAEDAPAEDQPQDNPEEMSEELERAESLRLTGIPGNSSRRGQPQSVHSEEELLDGGGGIEEDLAEVVEENGGEYAQTQAPFDADARTMPPAPRAGSAPALHAEEPDIEALNLEEEPVSSAPPPKPAPGKKDSAELPAWNGRARDYRDPVLETRKAETRKIQKQPAKAAPAPAYNQDVNLGEEAEAPVDIPSEESPVDIPSDEGSVDIPSEEGSEVEAVDIPLDLEEEEAPKPVGKKPAPAPMKPTPKIAPKIAKAPTAPIKAPVKPAPVATKPAPAAAKAAPAVTKPPAKAGADGAFTVFLSPPKGADKKQAAAEIIAEINGIDMDAAMELAGKMIVPVAKGVSEGEANRVKDKFKVAGLSCRITQKR